MYAASVAAIVAFAVPAFAESPAQAKDQDSTGQTQINSGTQQLNAENGSDKVSTIDLQTLTPVIAAGTTTAGQIQTITTISTVKVVRINDWASADKQAFDAARSQNGKQISDLQLALESNSAVSARLGEQSVLPASVVASEVLADGTLVVYVYDGA